MFQSIAIFFVRRKTPTLCDLLRFPGHRVDIEVARVRSVPRQNGSNGNIKNYRLQVSDDAKNWSEPVAEGAFANDNKLKRVMLDKPVKARYIRFTALSSQAGDDFASGAELGILAE